VKQSQIGAGESWRCENSTKSISLGARKQDDVGSVELGPDLRVLEGVWSWAPISECWTKKRPKAETPGRVPGEEKGRWEKGSIKRNTNTLPTQLIIRV